MDASIQIAVIGAIVSVVLAITTSFGSFALQRAKLRQDLRTEFMAEQAIRQLLKHSKWRQRSFLMISRRIGGFPPDELRQLLVRSGAVRFQKDPSAPEYWGLRERCSDLIDLDDDLRSSQSD